MQTRELEGKRIALRIYWMFQNNLARKMCNYDSGSEDFTLPDFYFWGYIKQVMYEYMLKLNDLHDLNIVIRDAVESVLLMYSLGFGKNSSST
jgi:hypothetical protein